jgi:hypothetical protein
MYKDTGPTELSQGASGAARTAPKVFLPLKISPTPKAPGAPSELL